MCQNCWIEAGSPIVVSPETTHALKLIEKVYAFSPTGGNLHLQLDDDNLEDAFFASFEPFIDDAPAEQLRVEQECFQLLASMSEDARRTVVGIYDGYISLPSEKSAHKMRG